jgi:hypothetical protein
MEGGILRNVAAVLDSLRHRRLIDAVSRRRLRARERREGLELASVSLADSTPPGLTLLGTDVPLGPTA